MTVSYVPPLITQYGFLISMQGEDIFVGAIREVKEETGVSQFFSLIWKVPDSFLFTLLL